MKKEIFDALVEHRLGHCKEILTLKDKEYSSDTDRLHNFVVAGRKLNCTPIKALQGMDIKHEVSLGDIINRMEVDPLYCPSVDLIDEKITDKINYLLLAEGLIEDRRVQLTGKPVPSFNDYTPCKPVKCCAQCGQYHGFHDVNCPNKDEMRCLNCGVLAGEVHPVSCSGESYRLVSKVDK